MRRMDDHVRPMLEAILLKRISAALAELPDGGEHETPERVEVIQRVADHFVDDVHTVIESEFLSLSLLK